MRASDVAIVQARITALPEPEAPIPTEWKLPDPKGRYARGSVVEFIPDPLTPLFGTLGAAIIDVNTRRLFAAIAGRDVHPNGMVHTINDYAYLNIKFTPLDMLRFLSAQSGSRRTCWVAGSDAGVKRRVRAT
jgi:pyruvate,water dikinase